ncbi:MAG: hypothetical protein ACLFSB_05350 [Chitinispirillaceae bacterium]
MSFSRTYFTALPFFLFLFLLNCSNPIESGDDSQVVSPAVHATDNFSVASCNFNKTGSGPHYITGVTKFNYTGSQSLRHIRVYATFRSSDGSILCRDTSFIRNETVVRLSDNHTNTFVSPDHPIGYYVHINRLTFDYDMLSDVQFEMTGQTFTAADPASDVVISGTPYERDGLSNQHVINNGPEMILFSSPTFVLQDSAGISYDFCYPTVYRKVDDLFVENSLLQSGEEGRLAANEYETSANGKQLFIHTTLLDWDLPTIISKQSIMNISDPLALKKKIRDMRDRETEASFSKIRTVQ